jgi:hypothetical protein
MPTSEQNFLGVVQELWRYPVKSMLGERLTATTVTESGLLGDRAYALRDTCDGKIATAKNPWKWPNLFDYRASLTGVPTAGVRVPSARGALPDGTIQRIMYAELNALIEKRPVRDGEIQPACVQACPSKAMTFGDEDDPQSAMMRRRIDNKLRRYLVLEEINAGPNVTYLRDIYQTKGKA